MQNNTITTKKALYYNKAGNEMLEGCLFCVYFDLGIFHYSIGMELCAGVCVFMYLFTAGYAVTYKLGGKVSPLHGSVPQL